MRLRADGDRGGRSGGEGKQPQDTHARMATDCYSPIATSMPSVLRKPRDRRGDTGSKTPGGRSILFAQGAAISQVEVFDVENDDEYGDFERLEMTPGSLERGSRPSRRSMRSSENTATSYAYGLAAGTSEPEVLTAAGSPYTETLQVTAAGTRKLQSGLQQLVDADSHRFSDAHAEQEKGLVHTPPRNSVYGARRRHPISQDEDPGLVYETRPRKKMPIDPANSPYARDNYRSKTASQARELVQDLGAQQSQVARMLRDKGKEINPKTGRIGTAKWLKRRNLSITTLPVKQAHENEAICKLVFSSDGQRLITVSKRGSCKVFRTTLHDLASKAGGGLPSDIDQDSELWKEEGEVKGHPISCWSAAIEPAKATFFVVVGGDNIIRLFSEGVLDGPLEDTGLASVKDLRLALAARNAPSTGPVEVLVKRLRRVLQDNPAEARRLGVLENPGECRELEKLWVLTKEIVGADSFDLNSDKSKTYMRCFDCDLYPQPLQCGSSLLATGWSNGDVKWFIGRKSGRTKNAENVTFDQWEWVQYQKMQSSADALFGTKFSPSGDQFVTTSKDCSVCVFSYPRLGARWGVGPGFMSDNDNALFQRLPSSERASVQFELISRLPGHTAPVLSLGFHPSGEIFASGGADEIGMLWTFKSNEDTGQHRITTAKLGMSSNFDLYSRGRAPAATRRDDSQPEWNSVGFLAGHSNYVTACAFRFDGIVLATASRDCTVMLWRMPRHLSDRTHVSHHVWKPLQILKCRSEVSSLGFGRRACMSLLWAGTFNGELYSWDTDTLLPALQEELPDDLAGPHFDGLCTGGAYNLLGGALSRFEHTMFRPNSTTSRDWSRMSTPHDIPSARGSSAGIASEDVNGQPLDPARFALVDPWETRKVRAQTLHVGARNKSSHRAGIKSVIKMNDAVQDETLVDRALRLMQRTVEIVLQDEPVIGSLVEIDQSGLIALIDSCEDPLDANDCVKVLGRLVKELMPLIVDSKLRKVFPHHMLRHGRRNPEHLLFRREEIDFILGQHHLNHPPRGIKKVFKRLPPIEKNEKGQELAHSLVDERPQEARKCLFAKCLKVVAAQLTWSKRPERAAQKVTKRLLEGLDANVPLPNDDFTNYCCLLYNLPVLYHRVAKIVQEIHEESMSKNADVLAVEGKMTVQFCGRQEEVDTLCWWSGMQGIPHRSDRISLPLFAASTPTWIGVVFAPGVPYALKSFSVYLALGGKKGDQQEATRYIIPGVPDTSPSLPKGLSFCCKILEWNPSKKMPGRVLWEGPETCLETNHFQRFDFPLLEAGLRHESYEEVFLTLSTEACECQRKHGYAYVAGIGERSRGGRTPPSQIKKGVYTLSGRRAIGSQGGARLNEAWVKRSEEDLLACKIVYNHV